jgi:hypothetical protein
VTLLLLLLPFTTSCCLLACCCHSLPLTQHHGEVQGHDADLSQHPQQVAHHRGVRLATHLPAAGASRARAGVGM